ncbi:MAG: hypothetical protein FWF34_02875 [Alphaproteobacteria bacterium]|nr:hypothetical protein [Alphaproteobacteria bacterium]MCL2890174.1 hypothetical protein [Alphaproteobacteria bacterium]
MKRITKYTIKNEWENFMDEDGIANKVFYYLAGVAKYTGVAHGVYVFTGGASAIDYAMPALLFVGGRISQKVLKKQIDTAKMARKQSFKPGAELGFDRDGQIIKDHVQKKK